MTQLSEIRYTRGVNSANNPIWMDGLRIVLGLFLVIKGILFLEHTTDVFRIFGAEQDLVSAGKAHFLTSMVHIVGGLMIMIGMLTRLALLCQIPILLGALMIVNPQRGVNFGNSELILSLIVTGLIVFFMIVGPGRYSVDNKILRPKPNPEEE